MSSLNIVSLTDVGLVRDSNQDYFYVDFLSDEMAVAIVCDGMGGVSGGNIASKLAVEVIKEYVLINYRRHLKENSIGQMLKEAAVKANKEIYDYAMTDDNLHGMGTTLILAFIYEGKAHIISVGDSRVYLTQGNEIKQVTKDHSIVQDMLDRGEITKSEAKVHPRKNIITRALGVEIPVLLDYFEIEFNLTDVLFICTDGFSNYVDKEKILKIIKGTKFELLAKVAVELAKNAGGNDNITVVAICR